MIHNEPLYGTRRVVRKFLFKPKTINGKTKWLKYAEWVEEYKRISLGRIASIVRWTEIWWNDE